MQAMFSPLASGRAIEERHQPTTDENAHRTSFPPNIRHGMSYPMHELEEYGAAGGG